MKIKSFVWVATALGSIFLGACGTPRTSNQPWDKPVIEDNNPGYNSPDPFPMDRGSKGTNAM